MGTTSLKLPATLKQRIVKLALATGKTSHAFMVEAITAEAERTEKFQAFVARAEIAKQHFDETGSAYDADEVNAFMRAKIQGLSPERLQAKKFK